MIHFLRRRKRESFFSVCFLLMACTLEWHFSAIGLDVSNKLIFCVSKRPHCSGDGVWISDFAILEVPNPGSDTQYRPVWSIKPRGKDAKLNRITYGITPQGYIEIIAAEPLQEGKVYEVGSYRFRMKIDQGKPIFHVAPIHEFQ
jgi:hypothetical protein